MRKYLNKHHIIFLRYQVRSFNTLLFACPPNNDCNPDNCSELRNLFALPIAVMTLSVCIYPKCSYNPCLSFVDNARTLNPCLENHSK